MARSVNKVILIGNLGKDAETKFTAGGTAVTRFSVATTRSWKDQQTNEWKDETNWTNVIVWRQENLSNYLTKGKQVYIEGHLAIDLGGVHGPQTGSVTLDAARAASLGLSDGQIYKLDFFQAERHTIGSNFNVQTTLCLSDAH